MKAVKMAVVHRRRRLVTHRQIADNYVAIFHYRPHEEIGQLSELSELLAVCWMKEHIEERKYLMT